MYVQNCISYNQSPIIQVTPISTATIIQQDLLARGSRLQNALVDFSQISNKSQSNKFYTFKEDGQTVEMKICAALYEPVAWYITIRQLQ